jgi:gluconokinase
MPTSLIVMGVAGAGKTTLAQALAERTGWVFLDADILHPPANVAKMRAGEPLTDADRAPWLAAVASWIDAQPGPNIVACSALKRAYRAALTDDRPEARLVYLDASPELVAARVAGRADHYFPTSLVASQFASLEPPDAGEGAIVVSMATATDAQVAEVLAQIPAYQA